MGKYDVISENPESTVVAEYQPGESRSTAYQSEAELEKALIALLQTQAYEYLPLTTEVELIANLRSQLEKLNNFRFSDAEWKQFFHGTIANPNSGIVEKTKRLQDNKSYRDGLELIRDDGTSKNIYLIDKNDIHNNRLQVINQYTPEGGERANRYDVTILVNGLPLVHVELKRRGVDIREAFNQINRYGRESFWAGSGLFEYVQIFVISNGTLTKYYSNTTRVTHIREANGKAAVRGRRTSNSFEFTSWWADAANRPIADLMDFGRTFFAKPALLNILTKYCVFTTTESLLLVMRPYQIVATEKILNRIQVATNYKKYGTVDGGGYIWHTTGSGKTLTSFKTAQLASQLPYIDKVLFVVDRKDLDYQTMKEYDRFEKGAANSNTSTSVLTRQLEGRDEKGNPHDYRIIITTIQKLTRFLTKHKDHPVCRQHVVIIFDECHRSQFGDMHQLITRAFKKYHLFGFTGTPIFAENAGSGGHPALKTTEQAFGEKLHTYTIVNAINDKNVLPFHIDYISTMKKAEEIDDEKVWDIDREKALLAPERIANIVRYIRDHFDQKTRRNSSYLLKDRGFNSILAASSIPAAMKYYAEFKKQMKDLPKDQRLKVALIYSFNVNEAEEDSGGLGDENPEDAGGLDSNSRDFLEKAIQDYNAMFQTSFSTEGEKFQNYYKDVSQRVKAREVDLLIVVNMFLTGFDATTLNTLWVDKNLRLHGLLQAFSRTNRILNSVKTFGNIVCFRNLEKAVNRSLALFGDKDARGVVIIRPYGDYYNGYEENGGHVKGYQELIAELRKNYPLNRQIVGESAPKAFIRLYGMILKVKNILASFDAFSGSEILSERDFQDYHSIYLNLYEDFRKQIHGDKENINDDIVFEVELIKQLEINIDYILKLVRQYHAGHGKDEEIRISITKSIDSSLELRSKKDLIESFINSLTQGSDVDAEWERFVSEKRSEELDRIIAEENLHRDEAYQFMADAFRDGFVQSNGIAIGRVLPPISRFSPSGERTKKRESVLAKLTAFFNRFHDLIGRCD